MTRIPYGYRIENGCAVTEPDEAASIRKFIRFYLAGCSIREAASRASLPLCNSAARHILLNRIYLGDDYYPAVIDRATFAQVSAERELRYNRLGRFGNRGPVPAIPIRTTFRMKPHKPSDSDPLQKDPAALAACLYSCIQYTQDGDVRIRTTDKTQMTEWICKYIRPDAQQQEED